MTSIAHALLPLILLLGSQIGGWMGIRLSDADRPTIAEVIPGSPAQKAGLRIGDVILKLDGKALASADALIERVGLTKVGQEVELEILRRGRTRKVSIKLGTQPAADRAQARRPVDRRPAERVSGKPYLGVELEESSRGVFVTQVMRGAPAQRAGLRKGDQLIRFGEQRVRTLEDLDTVFRVLKPGAKLDLQVRREGKNQNLSLRVGARPAAPARPAAEGREKAPAKAASKQRATKQKATKQKAAKQKAAAKQAAAAEKAAAAKKAAAARKAKAGAGERRPRLPKGFVGPDHRSVAAARRAGRPVMMMFGADWCERCKAMHKTLQNRGVAKRLQGFVRVYVDADAHSKLADQYKVEFLPHIELRAKGAQTRIVGYQPPANLLRLITRFEAAHARSQPRRAPVATRAVEAPSKVKAQPEKVAQPKRARSEKLAKPKRQAPQQPLSREVQQAMGKLDKLDRELDQLRREQRQQRAMLEKLLKLLEARRKD